MYHDHLRIHLYLIHWLDDWLSAVVHKGIIAERL